MSFTTVVCECKCKCYGDCYQEDFLSDDICGECECHNEEKETDLGMGDSSQEVW